MKPKIVKYRKATEDAERSCHADVRLQITLNTCFDSQGHDEPWRNELAKELNLAMDFIRKPPRGPLIGSEAWLSLTKQARAIKSIVTRVAEFEEIRFV